MSSPRLLAGNHGTACLWLCLFTLSSACQKESSDSVDLGDSSALAAESRSDSESTDPDPPESLEYRSTGEQLLRASMALRGVRPSLDEWAEVQADPEALEGLIDRWLTSAEFGETLRDMHAEQLLLRADLYDALPPIGELTGVPAQELFDAINEAPLRLVEEIVLSGQPYSQIVESDELMVHRLGARVWGMDWQETGEDWQRLPIPDARPPTGILSDPALWLRHPSNGNNYHRGRADRIADVLLCESFQTRDLPISGDLDLTDPEVVAEAVNTNPDCVGCHQALDPLAAFLWGWVPLASNTISNAVQGGCPPLPAEPTLQEIQSDALCYPILEWVDEITYYDGGRESSLSYTQYWDLLELRAPNYYGLGADPAQLGSYIAEDPRFYDCSVKRFYGYLTQSDPEDLSLEARAEFLEIFEDSGYDARALVKAIVLSDAFTATSLPEDSSTELVGLQALRPQQADRMIADLTGFSWESQADHIGCEEASCRCTDSAGVEVCFGDVNMMTSDGFGFRTMAGGMDGYRSSQPTHTTTPMKLLVMARLAAEAAGYAVHLDLEGDAPVLLDQVQADTRDEASIRQQLQALHLRILGEELELDSSELDLSWTLFSAVLAQSDSPAEAWRVVLTAMLQDHQILFY